MCNIYAVVQVRRAANFLHRNPQNPVARAKYFSLCRKYKKLLKKAEKQHLENQMKKLIESIEKTKRCLFYQI